MNTDKKVIIIGGGPAGLTAAYELCETGVESIVLEKDTLVGGISRTVNYKDFYFDIGGHRFFTKVKAVDDMWREVIGNDFLKRERLSRIYYNGKFFHYPLRAFNALAGVGIWNSFLVVTSFVYSQLFPIKPADTFEAWVSNRFGRHLYNIFFKNYTEKVWGMPCSEISAEWSAQRIKGLSLVSALKDALIPKQKNQSTKKVIATLIDEFDYPKKGPGMIWEAVADIVTNKGSQVYLSSKVDKIFWNNNKINSVEISSNGQSELIEGTDFISSMPIRDLIQCLEPAPPDKILNAALKLNYRDFITIVLIINRQDVFPDNWIYIHDADVKVGRLQNYKNWSPYMVPDQNKTCLGMEYFCFEGDELWTMPDQDLIRLGIDELQKMGFIHASEVEDGTVVRMPKTYPIYDPGYQESIGIIRGFLDSLENLQPVGRNGMHRYNNMDHSMLTAMLAVENILGKNHNLWQVNVEEEYHEEIYTHEEHELDESDKMVIKTFGRIDKLGFATALGSVSGLLVFLATVFLVIKGGETIGPNLALLSQFLPAYTVTIKGAFIGFTFTFFWGFFAGWIFAYIRNILIAFFIYRVKRRLELLSFRDFIDNF